MQKNNILQRIMLAAGLAVALTSAQAVDGTWTGAGADNNWTTAANWNGPISGGYGLIFGGNTRLSSSNDFSNGTNFAGLTFAADAGSFTLTGNPFTLTGTLANNSANLQIIQNNIAVSGNRTFDIAQGEVRFEGTLNGANITKIGKGTMTISNVMSLGTAIFYIRQGKVLLDAASGGQIAAGDSGINFGENTSAISNINQGGIFEVKGKANGSTTASVAAGLYLNKSSGANRIVVDANGGDGTTLIFTRFNRLTGADTGTPTLNVDLSSSADNKLQIPGDFSGYTNSIAPFMTITDTTKTGFATKDGSGFVTRLTGMATLPTATGAAATNYRTSGTTTLATDVRANSLTIDGTGSVSGGYSLITNNILMEEGVGDYTIGTATIGAGDGSIIIHQYSTAGSLIITGDLRSGTGSYTNQNLTKTGPGKLIFEGDATNYQGATDVQGGILQLDGSLKDTNVVQVRDGATLSGKGTIGGGTQSTQVNIWAGGTLDASHSLGKALSLTGTLKLNPGATYQMDLTDGSFAALSVTGNVTLDGDLKLTLGYAPILNEEIDLLTYTGTRTGVFTTINGLAATPSFTLDGYTFDISYGTNRVWLTATGLPIPEPGSVILLFVAGCLILLRRHRA